MSVTDDIVEDIVELCEGYGESEFSHTIIVNDYLGSYGSYADELFTEATLEVEGKLKAKGIEVGL